MHHTEPIRVAIDAIKLNIDLHADSEKEPEKYNLYNAIYHIAAAIEQIQDDLAKRREEA
jgi:hypothetical protein